MEIIEQSKIKIANRGRVIFKAGEIIVENVQVDYVPLEVITDTINQISFEQVELPRFVGEWVDTLDEHGLFGIDYDKVDQSIWDWVYENYDYNVKKLHSAYIYGYKVLKEKLYTVEIPNPNAKGTNKIFLCKADNTGKVYICKGNFNPKKNKNLWLTEEEIKEDFDWAWQFREEVD
ncbi:TPA: DUF1642 domain-containing protein [Streptococcus suis]|nr:DUF1642 domain-containing protein [Streptococcus suis]HEP1797882.1 DUF1642 domain-containing protein [Streptococcus suis]